MNSENCRAALLFVRIQVGAVFLLEGLLKFISPDKFGVGRFIKLGLPSPQILATFVGWTEIICGLLVLAGLLTRWAAVPLIIDMIVAIVTTKLPILHSQGLWMMAHEARVDFAMLFGAFVLAWTAPGLWSLRDHPVLQRTSR